MKECPKCTTGTATTHHDDSDDDSKQADGAAEDLNDENLDEKRLVLCIGQRAARPDYADTQSTPEVAEAGYQPRAEHHVSCTYSAHAKYGAACTAS